LHPKVLHRRVDNGFGLITKRIGLCLCFGEHCHSKDTEIFSIIKPDCYIKHYTYGFFISLLPGKLASKSIQQVFVFLILNKNTIFFTNI
jgi:hypothetical protein